MVGFWSCLRKDWAKVLIKAQRWLLLGNVYSSITAGNSWLRIEPSHWITLGWVLAKCP